MANRAQLGKSRSISKDPKFLFASEEEKANRILPGGAPDQADEGPTFKQIEAASTGKNLANPEVASKSGNLKFGSV
jgi:hypothetical protein